MTFKPFQHLYQQVRRTDPKLFLALDNISQNLQSLTENSGAAQESTEATSSSTVTSVLGAEVSGARYVDPNGGFHTKILVTVTVPGGTYPQVITTWLSFDNGVTWQWQGWITINSTPTSTVYDCWLPNGVQYWKAAAIALQVNKEDPVLAVGAAQSATFVLNPTTITSVVAAEIPGSRYVDPSGGYHNEVSVTVNYSGGGGLVCTVWLSFDGGTTWRWQGWFTANATAGVAKITCWLPTNTIQTWRAAAIAGNYPENNPYYTAGAVLSGTFALYPIAVASVTATDNTSLRWQDLATALHTVVSFVPVQMGSFLPCILTVWISMDGGTTWVWQGWIPWVTAGETLYIGAASTQYGSQTDDTTHTPSIGTVYPPTVTTQNWVMKVAVGEFGGSIPVALAAASSAFSVIVPPAPGSTAISNNYIDAITYNSQLYGWSHLYWTLPLSDPNFMEMDYSVQSGSGIGASFVPGGQWATEQQVASWQTPNAFISASQHGENMSLGSGGVAAGIVYDTNPNWWVVPQDGNLTIRFRSYCTSRLASGSLPYTRIKQNGWVSGHAGTPYTGSGSDFCYDVVLDGTHATFTGKLAINTAVGAVTINPTSHGVESDNGSDTAFYGADEAHLSDGTNFSLLSAIQAGFVAPGHTSQLTATDLTFDGASTARMPFPMSTAVDRTGSYSLGNVYPNPSTTRVMFVIVNFYSPGTSGLSVNAGPSSGALQTWAVTPGTAGAIGYICFPVPPGWWYQVSGGVGVVANVWTEIS
jgi:hypothetical protein